MKKFSCLTVGALLCLALTVPASAVDTDVSSYDDFFDAAEYKEVQEAILNTDILYENGVLSDVQTRSDAGSQLGDSYKLHTLDQIDLVAALQEGASLSEIISDDYVWIISTPDNEAIRVDEVDGEWTVLGYSTPASANATTDLIQMDTVNEEVSTFSEGTNGLTELLCFEATMYHTNFVYMKTADGEFLIPYGSRPDLTGLENGELYTPQEVSEILAASFDGVYSAGENAGLGTQNTGAMTMMAVGGVVALVVLAGGAIFLICKRQVH